MLYKTHMKGFINWLMEGKFLYIFLILFFLIFAVNSIHLGISTEVKIRIYGLLLQLTGSITLIYSLRDKLILFKGWRLMEFFKDYFKRFPINKVQKVLNIQGSIHEHSSISANLRGVIRPNEDLKDIIRYFDGEISYLHERLAKLKNELKSDMSRIEGDLSEYKTKFSHELHETKKLISDSSVSNIWLDLFGIFTILTGLIFATIPDIIDKFLFK